MHNFFDPNAEHVTAPAIVVVVVVVLYDIHNFLGSSEKNISHFKPIAEITNNKIYSLELKILLFIIRVIRII